MRAVLALLAWLAGSAGASAAPALWVVHGAGATVYLFGTVHVLKANTEWRTKLLDNAFATSDQVEFELAAFAESDVKTLVQTLGFDGDHPLSGKLSPDALHRLDALLKQDGMTGESVVDRMQPWAVATVLMTLPAQKAGYSLTNGVEQQLRAEAVAAGKSVVGFETIDQQVHFLADMSQAQQVQFLESTMKDARLDVADLDVMVDAWQRGDVDALARKLDADLAKPFPAAYARLLVDRNRHWTQALEARLQHPGTVFVAVGAAHLAGPDSVQRMLEHDGLTVERVQ